MNPVFVFVDFDGVLHRTQGDIDRYFEHAELLGAWLWSHPNIQLVVSSSWREVYKLAELRELLFHDVPDLKERLVGVTSNMDRIHAEHERSAECRLWLRDHGHNFSAWLAIDDQSERFSPDARDHLLVCDPAAGLTQDVLDRAWERLEELQREEPERHASNEINGTPLRPELRRMLRPLPDEVIKTPPSKWPEIDPRIDATRSEIGATGTGEAAGGLARVAFESHLLSTPSNYVDVRALRADMAGPEEAAALARMTTAQLRRFATMRTPRVIALRHSVLGLRYPRWQFEPAARHVVEQLARALQGNGPAMLAWLETPLGALEGRAPRSALEQGESVQRILALAASEGL
ncbi:HAD domain-containing protein [Rhizobacter sp. OV335]|uniref:HAD domain-containing protein n=1 Tax=Rhizobacter sp. OV335 TaxID=1500264 RepID=UPI000918FFBF|nr:HAD domain-containing protein [Rhizobacter sp. OV335]SHN13592.1 hypothetical protein SAMN02787076_03533 [Rhizobacter sp. OV335]